MKRLFLVAFVASFVGIASGAAAVWGVWHYKDKVTHAATEKERTDEALAEYTLWLMGFTGLLAFATIGLGAATIGLYLTGEKQVAITREALIGDQRAWIITELEIGKDGVSIRDGHIEVDVRLKVINVGRTPALRAHTNMTVVTDVLKTSEAVPALSADSRKSEKVFGLPLAPNSHYYRQWYPSADDNDVYNQGPKTEG
ncbi:hypothetical protein ACVWW2_004810 [Bradyrhizobium sp. LM4.3]